MRSNYCVLLCFILSIQLKLSESRITSLITTQLAQINIKGEPRNNIQKKKKVKIVDSNLVIDDANKSASETLEVGKKSGENSFDNIDKTDLYMKFAATSAAFVISRLLNKLDYKNKKIILLSRIVYFSYLILTQLLVFYLKSKISKANNKTFIELKSPGFMAQTKILPKKITVKDYDLQEAQKLTSSLFMEILFVLFVHIKQQKVQPLFYLPIMSVFNKMSNPIIRIHLFGEKAINKLSRPFKTGFEDIFEKLNQPKSELEIPATSSEDDVKQNTSDIIPNLVLDNEEESVSKKATLKQTTTTAKGTPNLINDNQVEVEEDLDDEISIDEVTSDINDVTFTESKADLPLPFSDNTKTEMEEELPPSVDDVVPVVEEGSEEVEEENSDIEL